MPLTGTAGHLLQQLSGRRCCLFIGSGFSRSVAKLGGVKDFKDGLLKSWSGLPPEARKNLESQPLDVVAELYQTEKGRNDLLSKVWAAFNPEQYNFTEGEPSDLLTEFDWNAVYTTNYDAVIEHVLNGRSRRYRVVTRNQDLLHLHSGELPIFKLHGCVNEIGADSETGLVLAESDYFDHLYPRNRDLLLTRLRSDLSQYTFVFVGYGLRDPTLRRLWASIFNSLSLRHVGGSINRPRHFAVVLETDPIEVKFWESYGVYVLPEDQAKFLVRLRNYLKKIMATVERQYFFSLERRYLIDRNHHVDNSTENQTHNARKTYESLLGQLSFARLQCHEIEKWLEAESTQQTLVETAGSDIYRLVSLVDDLKLPRAEKQIPLKWVAAKLSKQLRTSDGEKLELAVSAVPLIWDDLEGNNQQSMAEQVVASLERADSLTVFKITQVCLTLDSPTISEKVLSFIEEHMNDGGNELLNPSSDKALVRMLRRLVYSLASSTFNDVKSFNGRLLEILESARNPLIIWETGVAIAERCEWDRSLPSEVARRIRGCLRRGADGLAARYLNILERPSGKNIALSCNAKTQLQNIEDDLVADMAAYRTPCELDTSNNLGEANYFDKRLALTLHLHREKNIERQLDFLQLLVDHLGSGIPKFYVVYLSLPAILSGSVTNAQKPSVLMRALKYSLNQKVIAHPLMHHLWHALSEDERDLEGCRDAVHFLLDSVWQSEFLKEDNWSRYRFVVGLGHFLRSSVRKCHFDFYDAGMAILREVATDKNERKLLCGLAQHSLREVMP